MRGGRSSETLPTSRSLLLSERVSSSEAGYVQRSLHTCSMGQDRTYVCVMSRCYITLSRKWGLRGSLHKGNKCQVDHSPGVTSELHKGEPPPPPSLQLSGFQLLSFGSILLSPWDSLEMGPTAENTPCVTRWATGYLEHLHGR